MEGLKMRSPEEEEEFEIIFQHAAASPWEEAGEFDDIFVPNDDVSSLYFPKDIYVQGDDTERTDSMSEGDDDDSSLDSPMEQGQLGSSLPTTEEVWTYIETSKGEGKSTSREQGRSDYPWRGWCFCFVLALMAIGSFLCGIAIQTLAAANGAAYQDTADDEAPRRSNYTAVKEFVVEHGVSRRKDFEDPASPQARAASWLANMDQANLAVPVYDPETPSANDYGYMARYVMTVLYFATNGENWHQQFNFLTMGDVCTWTGDMIDASGTKYIPYGVDCGEDGTISGVYLDRMGLDGSIPREIGKLTTLNVLDLTFNDKLVGSFHEALCDLVYLDSLYLGHTHISGELPACIGNLKSLRSLFLSDTLMEGPLPPSLSKLTLMEGLMMDNNGFSGDITTMFENMTMLQNLFLENNKLSGTMGDTFLNSNPSITQVDISDNDMVGVLPLHFFDGQSMPNLQMLDLHENRLNGVLPDSASGNNLLRLVALQGNSISGSIPISWTQSMTNLDHLDLSSNELEGPLKPEIGDMTNLKYLSLSNNHFDAGPIPESFAKLTNMHYFLLESTNRQGSIPDFIGSTWSHLRLLDLNKNELQGAIPESIGNLQKLRYLLLNRNQLLGQVPASLVNLVNLQVAFLEGNQLSGDLDSTLCTLPNFSTLENSENNSSSNNNNYMLVADCGPIQDGEQREPLKCQCCQVCCVGGDVNHGVYPSVDPTWLAEEDRIFGDDATRFINRNYIDLGP